MARLQRVLARLRADLDVARSQPLPVVHPGQPGFPPSRPGHPGQPGFGGPPPVPPRDSPDMVGNFSDRMQGILQAAEEEAEEIRAAARKEAKAEAEAARAELAELVTQRDAVLGELTRLRGQLEGLLSAPTARFAATPPGNRPGIGQPAPSGQPASGHAPAGNAGGPPSGADRPRPSPRPKPRPVPAGEAAETAVFRVPEPQGGELFRSTPRPGDPVTTKVPLPGQARAGEPARPAGAPPARSAGRPEERDGAPRPASEPPKPRSGDAGSAEKPAGEEGTGRPSPAADETTKAPSANQGRSNGEVEQTMVVNVVRPQPSGAHGAAPAPGTAQNTRSGGSEPERAAGGHAADGSAAAAAAGASRGNEK